MSSKQPRAQESAPDSIVPDGFDLKAALDARSDTSEEDHPRCRRCESAAIRSRNGGRGKSVEHYYYCANCGFRFDYPEVGGE